MNRDPIRGAVQQLRRFPGIGEKSATRLVYWLLRAPPGTAGEIATALSGLVDSVKECSRCGDLSGSDPCQLCTQPRNDALLAVVESPQDVLAIERSGEFRGRYHVLHGTLSPLEGRGPDSLRIKPLLERLRDGQVREVLLATNPTVEGDATALYLARLIHPIGVRVTRLAHGLPVGAELEYADAPSLARALQFRRDLT